MDRINPHGSDPGGCAIFVLLIVVAIIIAIVWWSDKDVWRPEVGDTVMFKGTPVVYLGSAGRDTSSYIVRLADGTERHALRAELSRVTEKP